MCLVQVNFLYYLVLTAERDKLLMINDKELRRYFKKFPHFIF